MRSVCASLFELYLPWYSCVHPEGSARRAVMDRAVKSSAWMVILCVFFLAAIPSTTCQVNPVDYEDNIDSPDIGSILESLGLGNFTDILPFLQSDELLSTISSVLSGVAKSGVLDNLPFPIPVNDTPLTYDVIDNVISQFFADLEVSETCRNDLLMYLQDIVGGVPYARKMYASFGQLSPEEAQFTGLTKDLGNMWLCGDVKINNGTPPFDGKYFVIHGIVPEVVEFDVGTCFPSTCTAEDLSQISGTILETLGVSSIYLLFFPLETAEWQGADVFVVFLLCVFGALVVAGSVYDLWFRQSVTDKLTTETDGTVHRGERYAKVEDDRDETENAIDATKVDESDPSGHKPMATPDQTFHVEEHQTSGKNKKLEMLDGFLMAFSAVSNGRKILSTKKSPSTMAVLNGLRVFSMFWIILGHSIQFYLGKISNPKEGLQLAGKFSFLAILNATVSVDTFFVMSGFLVTFLTLKQIAKSDGKMNWGLFYFHRWWRLTPVYMIAMAIWGSLAVHFGGGIGQTLFYKGVREHCDKYWWTHPLYINNLYPFPGDLDSSCIGWSWYLANDMQFYIISPIILILLYKHSKYGIGALVGLTAVSLVTLLGIVTYYGYTINPVYGLYNNRTADYPNADNYYGKPYTRINTYFVGMALGYIMYKSKDRNIKLPPWAVLIGWLAAGGAMFGVVYGTWSDGYERYVEQFESVIYLTFHRFVWCIGIAWIIFACVTGHGGFIGAFLGWKVWMPFGRLTYCAYLLHPIVIFTAVLNSPTLFHLDYLSISYFFMGNVALSYAAALILSLLVEGPTMGLEKVMFRNKIKK